MAGDARVVPMLFGVQAFVVKVPINGEKMKRKFMLVVSLFVVMALAACGPKSAPGLSVTDVQNTAVALAMTEIAMTQSVMPTNTPVPPTPTSMPLLPTTGAQRWQHCQPSLWKLRSSRRSTNANASPTPDCYQPAPPTKDLLGTTVQIKLVNRADGPVNLSMGMYEPNDKGECYTFGF